jgi:hypothetical protein
MGKVYYRHFAGTISGSPGSTSTISFDTALDAASDLKAIIIFAVDAKAQNDASYSVTGNGPMESYGLTDLTNQYCSDSSHRDEATGADLGDMSSSINSALLHLYDESADSTFAECSYTSHTTSGFTVTWATQPTGTGTQLTYTGYAICGPNVEAEARSDWISSTTAATVDTITFSSLTGLEAVNIISVPDMATLGSRRLENCGINRAWLNSNGDSNAVLEKHALEADGAIRTVQGGFDNGVVSGTSRTDAHWQWKYFYRVSGAISGNDLDLTIGGTNLTWGLRYMCLGLYLDGATTGQATNDTDTSTTFTPSPTVTNPGVIDGMVCGVMNATTNQDSAYSQGWTGTVFDESDTTVGAFGMGSSSSANLTTKQNIAARTTPQNLPNSSSLYYRVSDNNSSEKHAYVSSVNNTTGEVTLAWTPSVDSVAGRHGVYFVLGQQAGGGGGAAQTVTATGIASSEAFGTPTATAGTVQVSPQGIASGEAFGSPEVQPGTATIAPPGIGSGVVFGVPNLLGQVGILPVQIFSAEAFGTPTLSGGAAQLLPSGIPTAEAFGTPTLSGGALQPPTVTTNQIVAPNGRLEADTISHTDQYTYVKLEKSGALTGGETISYHWYFKVDSGLAAGAGETITFSIKDSGGTVVEQINWTVAYEDATPTVALGSTTTAGSGYTNDALEYVAISNDWVRCSITLTDFGSTGQDVAVTHTGEPGATSAGTAYDVTLWGSEVTTLNRTPTANELRPVSGGIVDFDAYPAEHRSLFGSYTDLGDNQYRVGITLTDDTSSADYARIEHYQANSAETTHQIYLSSPSVDDIDLDLLQDVLISPPKPGAPFFDIPLITHAVHELGNDGRVPTTVATFGYYAGHLGWWDTEGAVVEKEPQPYGGDKITVIVPPVRGNGSTP